MTGWADFFVAAAGASATLAGLVFVGVSINLATIMRSPRLPNRALESLLVLLAVLVVSACELVPAQPAWLLGAEVFAAALAAWAAVTALHRANLRTVEPQFRRAAVVQAALGQATTLALAAGGVATVLRGAGGAYQGAYWLVPGVVGAYAVVILNAWVLLVEINR